MVHAGQSPAAPHAIWRRWWPWAAAGTVVVGVAAALLITRDGPLPTGSLGAVDAR
jgi:hypothetical protein